MAGLCWLVISGGDVCRCLVDVSAVGDDLGWCLADPGKRILHEPVVENRHGDAQISGCKIQAFDQIPPQSWGVVSLSGHDSIPVEI